MNFYCVLAVGKNKFGKGKIQNPWGGNQAKWGNGWLLPFAVFWQSSSQAELHCFVLHWKYCGRNGYITGSTWERQLGWVMREFDNEPVNQNSDLSKMLLWACLICDHLGWIVLVGTSFSGLQSCFSWIPLFPILWAGESHGGRQGIIMHTVWLLRKLLWEKGGRWENASLLLVTGVPERHRDISGVYTPLPVSFTHCLSTTSTNFCSVLCLG